VSINASIEDDDKTGEVRRPITHAEVIAEGLSLIIRAHPSAEIKLDKEAESIVVRARDPMVTNLPPGWCVFEGPGSPGTRTHRYVIYM
jgi:hypothetical protein